MARPGIYGNLFGNIKGDIYGGVTAAIVALPLALAFGVASGIGAIAGLYGAIMVGFFAAIFGGTPSQVSGPTGPMTVAIAAVVIQYGDNPGTAFLIIILAGFIQIGLGILKVGHYVSYTPHSVVSGFMSGIGLIIILIQTLPIFGLPTSPGGPVGAIASWVQIPQQVNMDALTIGATSLAIMVFWPARLAKILPSALASLLIGTLMAITIFDGAPAIGNVPTGFPEISLPAISPGDLPAIVAPAIILALLGSIDSLLTSLVADSITRTRHHSNRELIGQGIGNIAAGLVGGLPGAGATMRTVVNVRAGGRTPLSGALHAIILLALVLGMGPLAEKIPHAVLAGILLKVGWDIIDWKYLRRIAAAPKDNVLVMLVTFGLTVFIDLITAVAVGFILASFVAARRAEADELKGVTALALSPEGGELSQEDHHLLESLDDNVILVRLRGRFSYASARELTYSIGNINGSHTAIIYDFSETAYVDTSAAMAVGDLLTSAFESVGNCYVCGLSGQTLDILNSLGALENVPDSHIFDTRHDVIVFLAS